MPRWDPSLSRLGEFAGQNADKAIFIAGDWGVATQMICFTGGKPEVVYETDHSSGDVRGLLGTILNSHDKLVYLVFPRFIVFTQPETRALIEDGLREGMAPYWEQQPVEKQVEDLKAVIVFKFKKIR